MKLRLLAEKFAARGTREIGIRWGESFPFYYVVEHPKSGGTWLARMVSDYLQIPFPQYSMLPHTFSCVVQMFGRHHPALRRVFYIYRDGRDVMTSLYFDRLRVARHTERPGATYISKTYERLLGRNYDPTDIVRHLPRFIEYEFTNPGRGTPLNWSDHVEEWTAHSESDGIVCLRYESLLTDCEEALRAAIETVTEEPADQWRLETTVEKMSMLQQTGRHPGQTDSTEHVRKGIAGDWKNYFSREAAQIFDELAGETLVRLGYEEDRNWIAHYDLPTS